mmetsp:Transcript_31426/g.71401  ORF Transcript_31426/g.71401 Transcript_31426/m.71401 type:complete len:411 (+) Transcript_31426:759-1991(+)
MKLMWKFLSSSFSKSAATQGCVSFTFAPSCCISAIKMRTASSSSMQPSRVVSLSSTLILTSFGWKAATSIAPAIFATASLSRHWGTPRVAAYRFAAASAKSRCTGSAASNLIAAGGRFGPLQNKVPSLVRWSRGKVCRSCEIESWNFSWNSSTANRTHMSKGPVRCSSILLMQLSLASCEVPVPSDGTLARYVAGLLRKVLASRGLSTKSCSKMSRAHSIVCSMACGKCLRVHRGIDSSGGSCESPYDCVLCGSTTCTLAFVPRVPDSSNGLANQTQRESTYILAWMLSSALTTPSSESQKTSSKVSSVSLPTRTSSGLTLRAPFMADAAWDAVTDLDCPTFACLKRNCRFRFETSILSMSVMVSLPSAPQHTPIMAKHFRNSQPRAPAPTRNIFMLPSAFWKDCPRTAI